MEDYVRRLCLCGYSEGFARAVCAEFARELGFDWLGEYVGEIEGNMAFVYVAEVSK